MDRQTESQAGGRQGKPATPGRRKRRRRVVVALALLAAGIGTWVFWPRQRHWEEITLDLGNGVTMRLVLIPAGKFMMGSPDSEPGRDDDEGPQHEVTISKPFYMGVFEVTQEQYEQMMGTNPSSFKGPNNPVERVSWYDAMEFCGKLSAKTSQKVTLPTEAQWEYACRAGTTTAFNTGAELNPSQANAGFSATGSPGAWEKITDWVRKLFGVKAKKTGAETLPVGSFRPNAFGLYDMHGNVFEWCADWHGWAYYATSPKVDPQGPSTGDVHILRGGDWRGYAVPNCRSAFRGRGVPSFRHDDEGFRVVVSPGED